MAPERPTGSARYEFPIMLYSLLEDCTFDDELCKIVSWQPHGLSFKIHDRDGFERIMTRWFKEKYESFRCLLEMWGFFKLSRGKDRGCWYQVNFGHGRKAELQGVAKDDFLKGMPPYLSPREEPDLYSMETAESSISSKKERLKTLRDNSASNKEGAIPVASKSLSHKRNRDGDDSSPASSLAPPGKKEKRMKKPTPKLSPPPSPPPSIPPSDPVPLQTKGGCAVCGKDDDHSTLLLCEGCETESHTYCLDPPLSAVPEEDWFCGTISMLFPTIVYCMQLRRHSLFFFLLYAVLCTSRMDKDRKELTRIIKTIPDGIRSRFGEVCFSKSGERAHWWPAMIFDPRTFLQNKDVVELCKRNLGKRYLVFYFENQDAFAAVPETWIISWEDGVKREYDKGKNVRTASKTRQEQYQQALEAARLALLGSTDVEDKRSDSSPEDSFASSQEAAPSSPLKEVDDDSVLCSKCGKVLEVSEGPVLVDGYWRCHECHLISVSPPPAAENALDGKPKPPTDTTGNPLWSADATWLAVRDDAIVQVGGQDATQVEIDDEVLKGITQRPSGKWQAQVYYAGKSRYIGVFQTRQQAALAFKLVRSKLRPHSGDIHIPKWPRTRKPSSSSPDSDAKGAPKKSLENRASAFIDKKPDHEKQQASGPAADVCERSSAPRYIDNERTKILLETPLCRYYSNIPICDL